MRQGRDGSAMRPWQRAICDARAQERLRSPETRRPKLRTGAPRGSRAALTCWERVQARAGARGGTGQSMVGSGRVGDGAHARGGASPPSGERRSTRTFARGCVGRSLAGETATHIGLRERTEEAVGGQAGSQV